MAGAGGDEASATSDNYREAQAATDLKILTGSDITAQISAHYRGAFTTHNNRAVMRISGGWYRYTCNFAEGNYRRAGKRSMHNEAIRPERWNRQQEIPVVKTVTEDPEE